MVVGDPRLVRPKFSAQARQIMLDFWAQYADSVTVVADEWSATVTYRGQRVIVTFPGPPPENRPPRPTQFERVLPVAVDLVDTLNKLTLSFDT